MYIVYNNQSRAVITCRPEQGMFFKDVAIWYIGIIKSFR